MDNKAITGQEGEEAAASFLMEKGCFILERNYRYKRSEIDIIARRGDLIIFVEVKTKSYMTFGYPEEAVDEKKINKVQEGAENYIFKADWKGDIRFDVIAVKKEKGRYLIDHFEDAFH